MIEFCALTRLGGGGHIWFYSPLLYWSFIDELPLEQDRVFRVDVEEFLLHCNIYAFVVVVDTNLPTAYIRE